MIIPDRQAQKLQRDLFTFADLGGPVSGLVRWTPDGKGSYLISEWQNAIDNVFRYLKSDLLYVVNNDFVEKYGSLLDVLRRISPFGQVNRIVWEGTFLDPTEKLIQLTSKYIGPDLAMDRVNTPFIEEVERIFAEAGVPWSPGPVLPIIAPSPSDAASTANVHAR